MKIQSNTFLLIKKNKIFICVTILFFFIASLFIHNDSKKTYTLNGFSNLEDIYSYFHYSENFLKNKIEIKNINGGDVHIRLKSELNDINNFIYSLKFNNFYSRTRIELSKYISTIDIAINEERMILNDLAQNKFNSISPLNSNNIIIINEKNEIKIGEISKNENGLFINLQNNKIDDNYVFRVNTSNHKYIKSFTKQKISFTKQKIEDLIKIKEFIKVLISELDNNPKIIINELDSFENNIVYVNSEVDQLINTFKKNNAQNKALNHLLIIENMIFRSLGEEIKIFVENSSKPLVNLLLISIPFGFIFSIFILLSFTLIKRTSRN